MAEGFKVYWQPGCSSCLRAKEFLAAHGVAYESIDVRARPDARDALARLGARSVPVVARGRRFVFAQDLDELARFVGVDAEMTLYSALPAVTTMAAYPFLALALRAPVRRLFGARLES